MPDTHTSLYCHNAIWVDRVYEDRYESLGRAALYRGPAAFLPDADRPHDLSLTKYLPAAMPLSVAGRLIVLLYPPVAS